MKQAGYTLIAVGFLVAAWASSQHATEMPWAYYVPGLIAGVAGVVLARSAARSASQAGERLSDDARVLATSVESIVAKIEQLDAEKEGLSPYDIPARIDATFPDDINRFVEARETIAHLHGLEAYANVMNEFAAGERYLNRVWSAAVDGYVDEVREYIGRAREQFTLARDRLDELTRRSA